MAMRVRPLQDRVIVRRIEEQEQKSAGGIIIPDTAKEKPQEGKEEGRRFSEVRYGRFERSLTVPAGLDPEKVTARYENGVLEVTAPLPPGFASRKVPIQIESHGSKKAA